MYWGFVGNAKFLFSMILCYFEGFLEIETGMVLFLFASKGYPGNKQR